MLIEHLKITLNPCQAFIIPFSGYKFFVFIIINIHGAMCQRQRIQYSTRWYFSSCLFGFQFTWDVECRKLVLISEEQIFSSVFELENGKSKSLTDIKGVGIEWMHALCKIVFINYYDYLHWLSVKYNEIQL